MERKQFLKTLGLWPLAASCMPVTDFHKMTGETPNTDLYPVLFVGHGSPMNAIEENQFSLKWRALGKDLPQPTAILCISAHWETKGTFVTAMDHPSTIHDFGGFPKALFDAQYPAPGSPTLAAETRDAVHLAPVGMDTQWGLDHGCWSVLKQMYPEAKIPVIQLSLDYSKPARYHYDLARELASLRTRGVLILGSGNMVHNLGMVAWDKLNESGYAFDWAREADSLFKKYIDNGDHQPLINYGSLGKSVQLAIPTPEHYLPMLYALALKKEDEELRYFNDVPVAGSLTMTSLMIG